MPFCYYVTHCEQSGNKSHCCCENSLCLAKYWIVFTHTTLDCCQSQQRIKNIIREIWKNTDKKCLNFVFICSVFADFMRWQLNRYQIHFSNHFDVLFITFNKNLNLHETWILFCAAKLCPVEWTDPKSYRIEMPWWSIASRLSDCVASKWRWKAIVVIVRSSLGLRCSAVRTQDQCRMEVRVSNHNK